MDFTIWDFCDINLCCFMEYLEKIPFHCLLMNKSITAVYLIHSLLKYFDRPYIRSYLTLFH